MSRTRNLANAAAFAVMIEELLGGATVQGLRDTSGVHLNTAQKYVRALRRRGLLRVSAWEQDPRGIYSRAVFELRPGKDVPRPPGKRNRVSSVFQLGAA